ncbi:rho GTPase-activating protein 44-like [Limulus polyphemus]|uniref:Rho GTPase-activating protein 44-like n=1 Tax=Limulus polyphemus TaxID=6850 RepID=A0ABM1BDS8_LIMPO|nr:rho GTPase-activating protein 44-like [Limulus polyphemus]
MKKQFLRVKQIADQTFLRAERTEVLTEDLVSAEKRVELIKHSCQNTAKKTAACLQTGGTDVSVPEKRMKKLREVVLSQCMYENSGALGETSILGIIFGKGSSLQEQLGRKLLQYEINVEDHLLSPIGEFLENDVRNISKLRKHLNKLTLNMDSTRSRYQTAIRHSQQQTGGGLNTATAKADVLREELEDASMKVEQCKDTLAAEMFAFLKREPEIAQLFVDWYRYQADYHRTALSILEEWIPLLENDIRNFNQKPVYGTPLIEHLRVTNREIALVIEICVCCLLEYGMDEEGLFRIGGSVSKVKKLKNSFDAGIVVDMSEYSRDPHTVAGALKSYLRELPEPLLTFDLYDEWMNAAKTTDSEMKIQALQLVLQQLPEAYYKNLRYIIKFLAKLATRAEVNKMSPQNIAIVIAPNLIWNSEQDSLQLGMNMSVANFHSIIVEYLVNHADQFFPGETRFYVSTSNLDRSDCSGSTGDSEPEGSSPESLTSSPVCNSPKPIHRPGKKQAPPAPGGQPKDKPRISEKSLSQSFPFDACEETSSVYFGVSDSTEKHSKYDKIDKQSSAFSQNVIGTSEKPDRLTILQSHENLTGISMEKCPVVKPEKPERPEKSNKYLYSTNSLDRKNMTKRGEKPPTAPRFSKLSSHIEKPNVPPPGIPVRNHASSVERPSVPPPQVPSKSDVLLKSIGSSETVKEVVLPGSIMRNTESSSFKLSVPDIETNNLCVLEPMVLSGDDSGGGGEGTEESNEIPRMQTSNGESEFICKESSGNGRKNPQTFSPFEPECSVKQDKWNFLTFQTIEKPPERPPRTIPLPVETGHKDNDLADESSSESFEEVKPCVHLTRKDQPPERPPRTIAPLSIHLDPELSVKQPSDKEYCTVIPVGGLGTTTEPFYLNTINSQPTRPQPPPIRPRASGVTEDNHL